MGSIAWDVKLCIAFTPFSYLLDLLKFKNSYDSKKKKIKLTNKSSSSSNSSSGFQSNNT